MPDSMIEIMNDAHLAEELDELIATGASLRQVAAALRDLKRSGISRDDALSALKAARHRARDEAEEDRILEVMDLVSGFCPRELTVWDD